MPALQIKPDQGNRFILSGNIDSQTDLSTLLESCEKHLVLNLKDIHLIHSIGAKKWIEGIRDLKKQGKTLEYQECSEVLVEYCNLSPAFVEDIYVHSFEVTFTCEECDHYEAHMLNYKNLDMKNLPPEFLCPHCNEDMITEDEEAFRFLKSQSQE